MTRVAFIDPVGGAAGDMLVAALLDAGAPRAALDETVAALGLQGVRVTRELVTRAGLRACRVGVETETRTHARPAPELRAIVRDASGLSGAVRRRSLAVLDRLIAAEASVHGVDPDDVVLHELGGDDTLIDVCGVVALLDALGVERVVCGRLPLGAGLADGAHGPLPVPAPATVALLPGLQVIGVDEPGELVTPTAAAIVAALADDVGAMPPMTLEAVGVGAGTRERSDRPNIVRVFLGKAEASGAGTEQVLVLEANVDDLLPELLPDVIAACLDAGALDAWSQPILMKKGRPGLLLSVLARPEDERGLADTLLHHASTLGVRVRATTRHVADRASREVLVDGHVVRVKLGLRDGAVINIAPEHDDCAAVAAATGRPVKQIWAEALAAAVAEVRTEGSDAVAR